MFDRLTTMRLVVLVLGAALRDAGGDVTVETDQQKVIRLRAAGLRWSEIGAALGGVWHRIAMRRAKGL